MDVYDIGMIIGGAVILAILIAIFIEKKKA